MLRFLEAGLVAAARQLVAVAVVTLIVSILTLDTAAVRGEAVPDAGAGIFCSSLSEPLVWLYFLLAFGLSLTKNRAVMVTAERIHSAARVVGPKHGARPLAVQLVIAALLLAALTLRAPPDALVWIVRSLGIACAGSVVWAAIASVGMAGLGATAHAAVRAF
ncbi:MAG: hypothetical protein AB7O43_09395 [Hyphomicrobiaceae bacterium]